MNRTLWNFFTSLRLTVALLLLSIVLVFIGTVAQADEGLYQAQARYFKQWLVWAPMLFGHRIPLLLPGGYLLGTGLLINLLAAHIKRFHWSWKKFGIHLTHLGIVVLLVGQLATDMLAKESMLRLREGESKNYTESHREHELVIASDASAPGTEEVVSIPESLVAKGGDLLHEKVPFTLRIREYRVNGEVMGRASLLAAGNQLTTALATLQAQYSSPDVLVAQAERSAESPGRQAVWRDALKAVGVADTSDIVAAAKALSPAQQAKVLEELKARFQKTMIMRFQQSREADGMAMRYAAERISRKEAVTEEAFPVPSTQGDGKVAIVVPRPEAKDMDSANLPYAVVEVLNGQASLGSWLLSPMLNAQDLQIGGKTYRVALRAARHYEPFSVKLLKTTHETYRGTEIPKNFQSRVQIENPSRNETRDADIYMNNPLRYSGLTFFQYQMGQDERYSVGTSTLQVVRNPSWLTPYLGCILVGLGMCYQFLFHLTGFIAKRRAA